MDVGPTSPQRLAMLLPELMGLLHSEMAGETLALMHDSGLTMPQMVALHVLRYHGAQSVSSLQDCLRLSASATSHLIDRLVEHGHVTRVEDPADRRQKRIEIRPDGVALLDRMNDARVRELSVVIAQIDPHLQDQLTQIVERVVTALQTTHRAQPGRPAR